MLYSVTTHFYSKIFNTKINKWVWGTFDISTYIYVHTHTLEAGWRQLEVLGVRKREQVSLELPL